MRAKLIQRPAAFAALVGPEGASAALLAPEALARAEEAMVRLGGVVRSEVEACAHRMVELARNEQGVDEIFALAHQVRGLAGFGERLPAGRVAGTIRAYGRNAGADFRPDWNLLRLLCAMLIHAVVEPESVSVARAEETCRVAVASPWPLKAAQRPATPGRAGARRAGGPCGSGSGVELHRFDAALLCQCRIAGLGRSA